MTLSHCSSLINFENHSFALLCKKKSYIKDQSRQTPCSLFLPDIYWIFTQQYTASCLHAMTSIGNTGLDTVLKGSATIYNKSNLSQVVCAFLLMVDLLTDGLKYYSLLQSEHGYFTLQGKHNLFRAKLITKIVKKNVARTCHMWIVMILQTSWKKTWH